MQDPDHERSLMKVGLSSPPDREALVADLFFGAEQWAEVNQEGNTLNIEIYPRRDGQPWQFSCDEALKGLLAARQRLLND